jgi:acetyl esterase
MLASMKDPNASTVAEPTVRAFLESLPGPRQHPGTAIELENARAAFVDFETAGAPPPPRTEVDDHTVFLPSGKSVAIRIVRPPSTPEALPAVMFFHGGGWVFGDRESHGRLIRELAIGSHAAVVFVDFDRSPEAHYPVAIEQAYGATLWVAQHGSSVGIDPSKIALSGDSAGGNLAAVVAILSRRRGAPKICSQVLFYPVLDAALSRASYQQYGEGFMLTREGVAWTWDMYAPELDRRLEPTATPLNAAIEDLRGLPPALIIVGEHDVLRDEGEEYARRLMAADVPVTAVRYLGMIHAFVNLGALAETPSARAALAQACAALREAFKEQTSN